jgi:two-component system OmpR family sensor kinase
MRSLFWRIFLAFWAAMTLTVIGVVAFTLWKVSLSNRALESAHPEVLAREATTALEAGGRPALVAWVKKQAARDDLGVVLIVDAAQSELLGRPLSGSEETWIASRGELDLAQAASLLQRRASKVVGPDGSAYWLMVAPRSPSQFIFPILQRIPIVTLALAIAVSALMCLALARYLSSPIRKLRDATRAVSQGHLGVRVTPSLGGRRDELGSLATDFDTMAEHLRALLESRQQLMRDLSHELRSPLARLQIALGLARRPGANLTQELGRIEREARRLDIVIGQILKLARLDDPRVVLSREPFDLRQLLEELVHDANLEARARHVQVVLDAGSSHAECMFGDRTLVASAIENVLRNAIRYTRTGGTVRVVLAASPRGAELLIQDEGPGVPVDALAHIFEAFVRLQREDDARADGHGVGLAITERIVRLHGGSVCARNRESGGLEVEMRFPLEVAGFRSRSSARDIPLRRSAHS